MIMKPIFTIFISIVFFQSSIAQTDWKEHLSHDRTAYALHGHIMDGGGAIILKMGNHTSPMNTT